jgi:hypothetical protein
LAGRRPFRAHISLELEVHCTPVRGQRIGDLDNFVTGVCDGLMAADPRIKRDSRWDAPDLEAVHPSRTIAIEDDDAVVAIVARKISGGATPCYRIALEGE